MIDFFRSHISARLAMIWLVVAVPLSAVLLLTYSQWYQARYELVAQERVGYARSAATSMQLLLTEMRLVMRSSGAVIADAAPGTAAVDAELQRLATSYPVDYAVFADASGRVVSSSDPLLVGSSVATHTAFNQALTAEGGGLEPSEETSGGKVGFHVAQAIPARAGRPPGVLLMFVDVRKLHEAFPVSVPTGGVSVIDSAGQVVYQNEDPGFALRRARWGDLFPFVRQALNGKAAITQDFMFPGDGTRIAAFVPIAPIGWAAGSSVAPHVALAPFYRALAIGLPGALAVGGLALLVAVMIARGIHRSLDVLASEAGRIGTGHLDEPVHLRRSDEIGQVAQSLETARAQLLDARRRAAEELETTRQLLAATNALASWTDYEDLLDRLARVVLDVTTHSRVSVSLWDAESQTLTIVHSVGGGEIPIAQVPLEGISSVARDVITSGERRLADYDALAAEDRGVGGRLNAHLALLMPMRFRGRVIGLITVDDPGERHDFTAEEIDLVEGIAAQAAIAVENARLFEIERDRGRFGASMVQINADLASSLAISETLPRVLASVREEVGAHVVAIADRVEAGWRIRELVGDAGPGLVPGFVFTDTAAPTLMRLLRERRPDVVPNVETVEHANRAMAARAGYRAYVAQPLIIHGEVTGALGVFFAQPRDPSDAEADYFRRVAFAVSLTEENSRLYASEHRIAETLQTALLALPERLHGVEFAHLYHSATEAARVGGDFYDLFELEGDRVGITIGDISGHGVDAAVLTSLVKNALRVTAMQPDVTPAQVMAAASRLLYENSPTEIFATVFFGVLHLDDGTLEYCNAGHTTGACVCSEGGGVTKLAGNSPLIGAFTGEDFEVSTAHVDVGEMLFLYTDGLTEARRDHELFGEERLFELLSRPHGGDPGLAMRTVVDSVLAFAGGKLSDDLAILAVCRGERPAEA